MVIMTSNSTIVGFSRQGPVDAVMASDELRRPVSFGTDKTTDDLIVSDIAENEETSFSSRYSDDEYREPRSWLPFIAPAGLIFALVGWTAGFALAMRSEFSVAITGERAVALIVNWTVPAVLIGIIWLILLRSSKVEASRFGDVAALLRTESEALEKRMRTVNEEITMAREFLAQNARELESVGRQSAAKLIEAAEQLGTALADSDAKAKTLEQVSNAAATNLEQLRKHLPVVTSAAKDVTNQIGSAGNSAQLQVKTLIAGLQRVADAGSTARENIEGLEVRAGEAAIQLSHLISKNSEALHASINDASAQTNAMAAVLSEAQQGITTGLANANEDVNALVDINLSKLTQQVEMLRESLSDLNQQSETEDARVNGMIERISQHIDDRTQVLADLDVASTDRTAKLAFAVEALMSSTGALNLSLDQSGGNADHLTDRSNKLLATLEAAKSELNVGLQDALTNTEKKLTENLDKIDLATKNAMALDASSDDLMIKLTTLQKLISSQSGAVSTLLSSNDVQFAVHQEQVDSLAAALVETRAMLEHLTDAANVGLVGAFNNVRESAKEAVDASQHILENEMTNVAERMSVQSKETLSTAISSQVRDLDEIVRKSFEDNILLSEDATRRIAAQLAEIDLMTTNLEARASSARDNFARMDEDSFARQMVTLTESLNSTAIDVAKILSNEVTDTSWAAYLKGDRGVFTRRAVRLLDNGEAKTIVAHYSDDAEFRDHVNRYIHDFEAMMRVLLSTRDGNAIGVTLLSSDVGKLYVALAQAIERLRN
jgi:hypothetical protein